MRDVQKRVRYLKRPTESDLNTILQRRSIESVVQISEFSKLEARSLAYLYLCAHPSLFKRCSQEDKTSEAIVLYLCRQIWFWPAVHHYLTELQVLTQEWKCTWKLHADRCWRNLTEYKQSTNIMLWFQFKEHSLYVSLFLKLWLVTISRGKKNYREKGWVPHSLQLVSMPWSFSLSFSSIYSESLCMCVYACCEVKILLLHPQMYLHLFQAKSSKILSPYWITMILLSKKMQIKRVSLDLFLNFLFFSIIIYPVVYQCVCPRMLFCLDNWCLKRP